MRPIKFHWRSILQLSLSIITEAMLFPIFILKAASLMVIENSILDIFSHGTDINGNDSKSRETNNRTGKKLFSNCKMNHH